MTLRAFAAVLFIVAIAAGCTFTGAEKNGQYASMEDFAQQTMNNAKTVSYYPAAGGDTVTANVTATKLARLEKKGEVNDLAPKGTLEAWTFHFLVQVDVAPEQILLVGGMYEEDGWFDLEGQGGHNIVALRYPDGSYDILYDKIVNDDVDFYGNHSSYEEALHDWYVRENGLALPLYSTVYDSLLAEYSDMVRHDFYEEFRNSNDFDDKFGADIGWELRHHRQDVYYALYDIDGNGADELIIAGGMNATPEPFTPWNYDLYAYDGSKAVRVFPDMDFGYRTNFTLYEGGVIGVYFSSSAAESGVDFYKLADDGYSPELLDAFRTVGHLEGDEVVFAYSRNGEEVTEDAYNAELARYEVPLTTLSWILIQ